MISFSRLIDALSAIPDPRRAQGRRFPLPYLLLFSVLAILSGNWLRVSPDCEFSLKPAAELDLGSRSLGTRARAGTEVEFVQDLQLRSAAAPYGLSVEATADRQGWRRSSRDPLHPHL